MGEVYTVAPGCYSHTELKPGGYARYIHLGPLKPEKGIKDCPLSKKWKRDAVSAPASRNPKGILG